MNFIVVWQLRVIVCKMILATCLVDLSQSQCIIFFNSLTVATALTSNCVRCGGPTLGKKIVQLNMLAWANPGQNGVAVFIFTNPVFMQGFIFYFSREK